MRRSTGRDGLVHRPQDGFTEAVRVGWEACGDCEGRASRVSVGRDLVVGCLLGYLMLPLRKRKVQHPTQLGYTALVVEGERRYVVDIQVHRGNPADAPQLVPAVGRVTAPAGRVPGTVVADRGFGTADNDRALAELGVGRIGLQRTGIRKCRIVVR